MKLWLGIAFVIFSAPVGHAQTTVEERLAELESRTQALEQAVAQRLGPFKLVYQYAGMRLNNCARGTFARSVMTLSSTSLQLECGYYELVCQK